MQDRIPIKDELLKKLQNKMIKVYKNHINSNEKSQLDTLHDQKHLPDINTIKDYITKVALILKFNPFVPLPPIPWLPRNVIDEELARGIPEKFICRIEREPEDKLEQFLQKK
eukprot:48336_1